MNIRRARGFFAIGGVDLSIGEQRRSTSITSDCTGTTTTNTWVVLADIPLATRVEGMIRNGQGRLTNGEERLLLRNDGGWERQWRRQWRRQWERQWKRQWKRVVEALTVDLEVQAVN